MHIKTHKIWHSELFERSTVTRLGLLLAGVFFLCAEASAAQVQLVFDRGLPTANLNNAAGANQSNIEWADVETPPETPWLPGDDFTLPGSGNYMITTIRVWSTDRFGLNLRGGVAGGPIDVIPSTYVATPVTYANSQGYQSSAGAFLQLYQIDFSVNISLSGGTKYQYFLDGPAVASGSDVQGPHLHGSNAALSGSLQQGADDTFLFLGNDGTVYTWNTFTGGGTYCGCTGWNKTSDANVQVFAVPYELSGQTLLFDRGLPTENLNNAAGADQSNIEWADVETAPVSPWLPGDDFTLPGTGNYYVSTIRVWSTDHTGLSLRGGVAGGPIKVIPSTYTATLVTYLNSQGYQTSAGAFLPLYQIDFNVNIPLSGGTKYQYFLDGPAVQSGTDLQGVRLHGSNAMLSGSPQDGADDTFLFLGNDGTVYTWNTFTGAGTYCGCAGWNKTSDGNVQVFTQSLDTIFRDDFEPR